jgi:hypothetical protein
MSIECRLIEVPLEPSSIPLPQLAEALIEEGLQRSRKVDCFDFVPSDYRVMYRVLDTLTRGRFCEWGSGMGIITGLAEMLGFEAEGVEISGELAEVSRQLLHDFQLTAPILTGDYHEIETTADWYFTYCWPGQTWRVEQRFLAIAPDHARLLICNGAADLRCKVRSSGNEVPPGG